MPQVAPRQSTQARPNAFIKYDSSTRHDVLIVGAYARMVDEGVIFNLIPSGSMSQLFMAIQPPAEAYFKQDATGQLWILAWFEVSPMLGPVFALWVSKLMRPTKACLQSTLEIIQLGLAKWGSFTAFTSQKKVMEIIPELGYDVIGCIPTRGGQRWVLYFTRKDVH